LVDHLVALSVVRMVSSKVGSWVVHWDAY